MRWSAWVLGGLTFWSVYAAASGVRQLERDMAQAAKDARLFSALLQQSYTEFQSKSLWHQVSAMASAEMQQRLDAHAQAIESLSNRLTDFTASPPLAAPAGSSAAPD